MATIKLCDLCGKPLDKAANTKYKVKREWESWPCDRGWETIEVHDECVFRLLSAVKEKKGDGHIADR